MNEDTKVNSTLRMMSRIGRLEALPRTGWLVGGIRDPESVASHSYEVCVLAVWLADQVEQSLDVGEVARIALAHDAGEALLTDLPSPVKAEIGLESVARAESRAVSKVFEGGDDSWRVAHDAYVRAESAEARLVKAADKIQMMVKALQYERQQRGDVSRFFEREYDDYGFELVGRIFEAIADHHRDGTWFASDLD